VVQNDTWRPVAYGLTKFVTGDAGDEFHLQMAASVIMIIPILIVYFITQRQFVEGIASTGLKG
jgi:ABC-type glycerol-3-phosphate transport system permease component